MNKLTVSRKEQKLREKARKQSEIRRLKSEEMYTLSQGKLMVMRFMRNKLAVFGLVVLIMVYIMAVFCEFFAPYDGNTMYAKYKYMPPQRVNWTDETGKFVGPYVYAIEIGYDPVTFQPTYEENKELKANIRFFVRGDPYKMLGLFYSDIHLFGTGDPDIPLFLLGTDSIGRDLLSRIFIGTRISSSVGLIGVFISFLLGLILGGISGYFGGVADMVVQRIIDFIISLPTIPIWMAIAAAVPNTWPVLKTYFCVVLILSLMGWTGLARVVRSKFMSLKNEDFVRAARVVGASNMRIIMKHMVPTFTSHLIASLSLSVPGMILGETSLSYLGIGLRPPAISWGILLSDMQNLRNIALYPWMMIPGIFIVITVMSFNFVGDGLRDAADPYSYS